MATRQTRQSNKQSKRTRQPQQDLEDLEGTRQGVTREQLQNLNQQLLARWTPEQRARLALSRAETVILPAWSKTAQNGGITTLRESARSRQQPRQQPVQTTNAAALAAPAGFTSVGGAASAAAAALARTRAILQARQRERQQEQQREYAALLERFQGVCRRCLDTGRVWDQQGDTGAWCDCSMGQTRQQAARARIVARIVDQAQVPDEYAQARLEAFPRQNVARALEAYAQEWAGGRRERGLVLCGPVGVGKTSLLTAALYRMVELCVQQDPSTPLRYRFADTAGWLAALRRGMENDTMGEELDIAQTYGLWVLDDLGRTPYTPWEQGQIWGAMKMRCDHHRPLFVTTNLTPEQLGERLSPAALDRLQSSCLWVTLTGKSMRRTGPSLVF